MFSLNPIALGAALGAFFEKSAKYISKFAQPTDLNPLEVHESGHAIVMVGLDFGKSIEYVSINRSTGKGEVKLGKYAPTKRERICIALAGICAEELMFGKYANPCTADLNLAKNVYNPIHARRSDLPVWEIFMKLIKQQIKTYLEENREVLEKLAAHLAEKEYISGSELLVFLKDGPLISRFNSHLNVNPEFPQTFSP